MDEEPGPDNINSLKITKAKINPNSEVHDDDIDGNPNGFILHVRNSCFDFLLSLFLSSFLVIAFFFFLQINDAQVPSWCLRADSVRDKKAWIIRLNYIIAIVKWVRNSLFFICHTSYSDPLKSTWLPFCFLLLFSPSFILSSS
jgi:hypothetical protein